MYVPCCLSLPRLRSIARSRFSNFINNYCRGICCHQYTPTTHMAFPDSCMCYCVVTCLFHSVQSPFIAMMNANYCNLEEQTLTLLLRSVRANCGLKVLKLVGNNLTGKGTFILSELRERERKYNSPPFHQQWLR